MTLLAIALAASVAHAPTPAAEEATPAVEAVPAETSAAEAGPDLYASMVAAAAAVAREGELPMDDSTDRARRMASSDRNEERYFTRAGATPGQYQHEWTGCRQIARRLASPRSDGSWMQAGFTHGGMVGGMLVGGLDAAFSQLRARRDIPRQCLIARGWRMVEPDEGARQRISSMSRTERAAYFERMLGAAETEPGATVTDLASLNGGGRWHPGREDGDGED